MQSLTSKARCCAAQLTRALVTGIDGDLPGVVI